ncbi:pilus assembly FimT family protein [Undibacterium sp. Di26W]|uniref:pilus assembly FimT family protein n=1 Tax=Undibacterium sp. Di26W TaxID=3413035 RepID=UPI003BF2215D
MINRKTLPGKTRGFSLIELLIAMVILSILTAIAYPSFQRIIIRTKLNADSTLFSQDLAFMKGKAKTRTGSTITMCPSSDGASCTGGAWGTGRIIFFDENADGIVTVGKDELLEVRAASGGTSVITVTGFNSGANIQYKSTGEARYSGVVKLCDSKLPGNFGISQSVLITGMVHKTTSVTCP